MNAHTQPQLLESSMDLDPISYWQLDEVTRFPITPKDWSFVGRLPDRPRATVIGEHSYDSIVNRKSRSPVSVPVRKLLATFPDDFAEASNVFEPVHWRFLFYLDLYPLSSLGSPSFDAHQAFQRIYSQDLSFVDVPGPWTGASESAEELLYHIRARTSDTTADVAKAAYTILAFARSVGFEKHDVLQAPWWQVWWIESYLAAIR